VAGGNGFVDQATSTAVFIAGSGRSGTTWLQELINHRRDHRVIFEPFTRAVVPFCSHFNWRQYIREADDSPRFLDPARRIISGDFRNDWTDQYNQRKVYKKRLVKDIRGMLLLHWLHRRFPEIPIVYIMRHPCAVIASQLRMDWHLNVNILLEQRDLVADFLKPYEYSMSRAQINLDHLTLIWCVENYVPLRQFRRGEILLVFYEELLQNPERELERIFRFIGQPLQASAFKQHRQPSAEARDWSAVVTGDDPLNSWRNYLDAFQISRILYFVGLFGLRRIYGEDPMPHAEAAWT